MDIKQALAKGIQQELLKHVPLDKSEPIEQLEFGGAKIEAHALSELQTGVRIKTRSQGTRYFVVQVKETL